MLADLALLIRLQQIDSFTESGRRRVADHPNLVASLDAKLAAASSVLAEARQRLAGNQTARREIEKDLAMLQSRLSKFKGQLMEVKTNKEYTAILKEIQVAQDDILKHEDQMLVRMLEADDLSAAVKAAERAMAADQAAVAEERAAIEAETARLAAELEQVERERPAVASQIPAPLIDTYDTLVRGRRGLALAEARGGLCTACHVRLRPQKYNEIRSGVTIIQCDSCQRILHFPPSAGADGTGGAES